MLFITYCIYDVTVHGCYKMDASMQNTCKHAIMDIMYVDMEYSTKK